MARFLDGPKVAKWIKDQGIEQTQMAASEARAYRAWRGGRRAKVSAVVYLLIPFGIDERDFPADLVSNNQKDGRPPLGKLEA